MTANELGRTREEDTIPVAAMTGIAPADIERYVVIAVDSTSEVKVSSDTCCDTHLAALLATVVTLVSTGRTA